MARSEIPMVINLRQNKNDESTAYGKYFAEVDSKEPLNLKGLAKHMTEHGKISSLEIARGSAREARRLRNVLAERGRPEAGQGKSRRCCGRWSRCDDQRHPHQLQPGELEGREAHLKGAEGGVRVHLRVSRGEREAHRRRQGEAIPEEDAADVCAGSYG